MSKHDFSCIVSLSQFKGHMAKERVKYIQGPRAGVMDPMFEVLESFLPSTAELSSANRIMILCDLGCRYIAQMNSGDLTPAPVAVSAAPLRVDRSFQAIDSEATDQAGHDEISLDQDEEF